MDVLHDQEDLFALLQQDHIERHRDVWVLDPRRQTRLVDEHRDELGIPRIVGMEVLDGDRARESHSAQQPSEMHGGHSTGRELVVHDVAPDYARSVCRGCRERGWSRTHPVFAHNRQTALANLGEVLRKPPVESTLASQATYVTLSYPLPHRTTPPPIWALNLNQRRTCQRRY